MKNWVWALLCLLAGGLLFCSTSVAESQGAEDIYRDCAKCHSETVTEMAERGGPHQEYLACSDCHLAHPEMESQPEIAACSDCHDPSASPHLALDGCSGCHPPHHPGDIDFAALERPREACLSCHPGATMEAEVSTMHSALACNDCHRSHGESPACSDCHDPTEAPHFALPECQSCHHPHRPRDYDFAAFEEPRRACLSCHPDVEVEEADATAHTAMACNDCHLSHRKSPACTDCHEPHAPSMSADDCTDCHAPHKPMPIDYGAGVSRDSCAACHPDTVESFEEMGAAHESSVGCYRCHQEHPPQPESTPTACSDCHTPEKGPHFQLADCRLCHQPHAPNERGQVSQEQLTRACFSCHPGVEGNIAQAPQTHGSMSCGDCHLEHLSSFACQDCHAPHTEEMTQDDCLRCHGPHNPGAVRFEGNIAAELCGACHAEPVETLAARGGAHREGFGCVDCHTSHPPQEGAVPACADCHVGDEGSHYALPDCSSCHAPHAPLAKSWDAMPELISACFSCHDDPMEPTARGFVSPHAEMGCDSCHMSHESSLNCLDCHGPHSDAMTAADCGKCHGAHQPTEIIYADDPKQVLCAACHSQVSTQMIEHGGAHRRSLDCTSCHQRHPAAVCSDCHGTHPQKALARAPECSACHAPEAKPHFAIGNCSECHPPHQPLQLTLEAVEPVLPACLSCHNAVGEVFADAPTAHRQMDCAECHPTHAESLACDSCHAPHGPDMAPGDCSACHSPHAPSPVSYDREVSATLCGACHEEAAGTLAEKGAAHREQVSCAGCHPQHPPEAEDAAVACGSCHSRLQKRHYHMDPCVPCHAPHAPLEVNLGSVETVRPVCVSCHSVVGRHMEYNPSGHSEMDCSGCHSGHEDYQLCLDCHEPHSEEMTHQNCLQCHNAHTPRAVEYGRKVPDTFCAACHQEENQVLQDQGRAHLEELTCVACHREHPPGGEQTVTDCNDCHEADDAAHFAVANCGGCHQGHAPRDIDFSGVEETRAACLSCHPDPGQAMQDAASAHNQVDCAQCHTTHEDIQACTGCHDPHTEKMTAGDCRRCHGAHIPERISIDADIPSSFCHGCHDEVASVLAKSPSRHGGLACLRCHPDEHGRALNCDTCHGWPHEAALHQKYPDCLKCHVDPHNLADL